MSQEDCVDGDVFFYSRGTSSKILERLVQSADLSALLWGPRGLYLEYPEQAEVPLGRGGGAINSTSKYRTRGRGRVGADNEAYVFHIYSVYKLLKIIKNTYNTQALYSL